ncbi:hypothetical protein [Acidiphilium sp. PM]|uniref:hypothetical protein n=1 Tax=Acidiphilium sp. PM TaxID=1043206 RepID=UPI0002EA716D|nr:hypothetical protein [Acidiphilium sp. PM]
MTEQTKTPDTDHLARFDKEFLSTSYLAVAMEVYDAMSGITAGIAENAEDFADLNHAYFHGFGEWLKNLDESDVKAIIAISVERSAIVEAEADAPVETGA